ncbi:MAG: hypothetical protein JWO56_1398 [Acidobacteria bacterium]|nr:hypothetical protein [Acidobacteriota bacterium]
MIDYSIRQSNSAAMHTLPVQPFVLQGGRYGWLTGMPARMTRVELNLLKKQLEDAMRVIAATTVEPDRSEGT